MKITALSAIILIIATTASSQTRVVHGSLTVFDTYPVKNIEVYSKKAGATALSDSLGMFTIVCFEKDGNAAVYGSRGGNGVILIELVK
ncbi:MAG: hypothetical protein KAS29_22110 [Bacteroidales bacterium]|nr:hypothetical protein [Bacteroidales bacterium]